MLVFFLKWWNTINFADTEVSLIYTVYTMGENEILKSTPGLRRVLCNLVMKYEYFSLALLLSSTAFKH